LSVVIGFPISWFLLRDELYQGDLQGIQRTSGLNLESLLFGESKLLFSRTCAEIALDLGLFHLLNQKVV